MSESRSNGIPCGNTIAIVGDPGTGKTTLLLTFLKYGKVVHRTVTLQGESTSPQNGASVSRALERFNRLIRPAVSKSDQEENGETNRIFVCLESSFARVFQHNPKLFELGEKNGCYVVIDASAFLSGRLEDQMRFSGTTSASSDQFSDEQWSQQPRVLTLGGVSNERADKFGLYLDAENKGLIRIELLAGEPGANNNGNQLLNPREKKQIIRLLTPPVIDPGQRVRLLKDLLAVILHHPEWQRRHTLLAVDSLSALLSEIGGRNPGVKTDGRRLHILNLVRWLEEVGVTSFLAAEAAMPDGTVNGQPVFLGRDERYLVSGIVQLDYHRYPSGDLVRYLRVLKMRGAAHDMRPHYYELGTSGLTWIEALFAEPETNGG